METNIECYRVANGSFGVFYPKTEESVFQTLLQAYQPFKCPQPVEKMKKETHFNIVVVEGTEEELHPADFSEENRQEEEGQLIVSGTDSKGLKGFCIEIGKEQVYLQSTSDYSVAILYLKPGIWQESELAHRLRGVFDTSLMLLYALRMARQNALLFHASTVAWQDKAYLFLGKSGTGKSTHSGLWLKHIENTRLLNDDNPVVYIAEDGTPMVSGSPWSGKTPCYVNEQYPIGGIVQLRQAPENKMRKMSVLEAYAAVRSSISGKAWEMEISDGQHGSIEKLIDKCSFYQLDCLPDEAAALLCHSGVVSEE